MQAIRLRAYEHNYTKTQNLGGLEILVIDHEDLRSLKLKEKREFCDYNIKTFRILELLTDTRFSRKILYFWLGCDAMVAGTWLQRVGNFSPLPLITLPPCKDISSIL
ncbi:hypothetical protein ACET3Z_031232 [Daucus carota]